MKTDVITVTPDDTLAAALALARQHRVRHLPVVLANGDLVGILSDRDIRLTMPSPLTTADAERASFLENTPIASAMSREVVTVGPDEAVEDAAKLLYRHRIGALPVVNADHRLRGIITETDILQAFVRLLGVAEPSSRMEVALDDRPGELGRALMIIGKDAGINVVSVIAPPYAEGGRKIVVLHLATIDPRDAIEALEVAGFTVGWPALPHDPEPLVESQVVE